jgi:hypothetical protein
MKSKPKLGSLWILRLKNGRYRYGCYQGGDLWITSKSTFKTVDAARKAMGRQFPSLPFSIKKIALRVPKKA